MLMQLPGAAGLSASQLHQLQVSAVQMQHHSLLELLLQHPAAAEDEVLSAWARVRLEAYRRTVRVKRIIWEDPSLGWLLKPVDFD